MRLRNKKTGEIVEALISACGISGDIVVSAMDSNSEDGYTDLGRYGTLAEFNDEWEDYAVAEPLIKDERIRKAVRAWVEIGKYEHIYYDRAYNRLADDYDFVHCIEFAIDPCPDAESGRCYTLTELCGEEKE